MWTFTVCVASRLPKPPVDQHPLSARELLAGSAKESRKKDIDCEPETVRQRKQLSSNTLFRLKLHRILESMLWPSTEVSTWKYSERLAVHILSEPDSQKAWPMVNSILDSLVTRLAWEGDREHSWMKEGLKVFILISFQIQLTSTIHKYWASIIVLYVSYQVLSVSF